jgi:tetratricopeptide (TPR) repeat protein
VRDEAVSLETKAAETGLIAGRYRLESTLGKGGMAVVHQVFDLSKETRCALKRLTMPERADRRSSAVALFEREFLTLSQLDHPRVVQVFDYGVDEIGPYYTMELIGGADLHKLVPLPWREACAIARDLCSVLALLHSRRMIYRDLGPRNVRYAPGVAAKLIDFGAMMPMGASRTLVGTPAFCAPEAVNLQPLDARTDLYALGVTLYFMLLGRVPYAARDFGQLREQWRAQPRRPIDSLPELPKALDELVMDLIHLDPALRPANAAEVMERLSAIAQLPIDEQLTVPQAYLSTPNLVGRDAELSDVRKRLSRARQGRGASVLMQGAAGTGRSRALAACVLEAKLLGMTVLCADASDALAGNYGVVRALGVQLLEHAPELAVAAAAEDAPVLAHVVPDLRDHIEGLTPPPLDADALAQAVQPALRRWVLDVSAQRPLLIAVDDVHRADEGSAAFVALLAQEVANHPVVIAATTENGATSSAHVAASCKLLASASACLAIEPLSLESTQLLLGSVFGDVPNLKRLALRLHAISSGNPRDLMQLAQHLVDKRVVRYREGAWTVPGSFDAADLPSGMAQALRTRVEMLSPNARELARAFALSPEQRFLFDECAVLLARRTHAQLLACLDELLAASVLRLAGERYELSQPAWVAALMDDIGTGEVERLHLALAELFERRNDGLRAAQHLLRAGQLDRGLDRLAEYSVSSRKLTNESSDAYEDMLRLLPRDWFETYEYALRLCQDRGRPASEAFAMHSRIGGLASNTGHGSTSLQLLLQRLARDAGLGLYAEQDSSLPARDRLQRALGLAKKRWEETPKEERVAEPGEAIRQLAQTTIQAVGLVSISNNLELARRLPSLKPLYAISPTLAIVDQLAIGVTARITGRIERTRERYLEVIDALAKADHGLDASHYRQTLIGVKCALAMVEAPMGLASSLTRADELAEERLHKVNAVLIRMLYHLWQGDVRAAERCRQEAERLRIQGTQRQFATGMHLLPEIVAHGIASDLTGVKRASEEIAQQAKRFPAWVPVLHYAHGEFHRIRGDYAHALTEIETALSHIEDGGHQIWAQIAGAHLRVLFELGRLSEARARGEEYLAIAERRQLGYVRNYVRMPLSLVHAALDEHDIAARLAQTTIDEFCALGITGLNLMLAYETRARVAVRARDQRTFEQYSELCAQLISASTARTLLASYERIMHEARRAGLSVSAAVADAAEIEICSSVSTLVSSMLESCSNRLDRARASLDLLVRTSGSRGGLLYSVGPEGPVLSAQAGELEASPELDTLVREYLQSEMERESETLEDAEPATQAEPNSPAWNGPRGERLQPVLLCHNVDAGCAVTGLAVLQPSSKFRNPGQLATELSRAAVGAGDAQQLLLLP